MEKSDIVAAAVTCLRKTAAFCTLHSQLCNVHTVDFIIGKKWDLLPFQLREELNQFDTRQLRSLTDNDVPHFLTERNIPHLFHFIADAKAHTLEALKICSSLSAVSPSFPKMSIAKKSPYWCMSPKKSHEVEVLASIISSLAAKKGVKVVVDVGSGKGYLSSYLALEHKLNVLAIDNSSSNTLGAVERNKKVLYFWNRSRKKHNSALIDAKSNTSSSCTLGSNENHQTSYCSASSKSSSNYFRELNYSGCAGGSHGTFMSRTHHVNASSDLSFLINDFVLLLNEENTSLLKNMECDSHAGIAPEESKVVLCSLHSCGNLSASLLKLFVSTQQAKILCSVGCCYHLIEEAFFKSPFATNGIEEAQEFGFPLSSVLVKNKYQLGRNARMLASQSIDRISEKETEPEKALFYRALLEVILRDKLEGISGVYNVGHISKKCSGFLMYVQKALKQLKLDHLQLSESDIEEYLVKYSEEEKKLYALQQLRIVMAPCIEALILLDRLVFLLEQEVVQEAHLVRLFNPVTSPRCYGVIAWK